MDHNEIRLEQFWCFEYRNLTGRHIKAVRFWGRCKRGPFDAEVNEPTYPCYCPNSVARVNAAEVSLPILGLKGRNMQHLNDVAIIRKEFRKWSRWNILSSVFYRPSWSYLADLYFGLIVFAVLGIGSIYANDWTLFLAIVLPLGLMIMRFPPALHSIYPLEQCEDDVQQAYRKDFQLFRFQMFAQGLRARNIDVPKVLKLSKLLKLESELRQAHPPVISRGLFSLPVTLFVGILAAGAGIEKYWAQGYTVIALAVIAVLIYFVGLFLSLIPPATYYEKELELFLAWYCEESMLLGESSTV
ncbi:hypothetical protein [Duganella sp. HH101]|uniref:hypothetical protein n=1 Tax=Duganella sp. HH101 TaxID=1781066 RepID=UPI000893F2C9|nr:hypothetical protein [Duganella sp. HH101]OEZ99929.1 hypothetical protein DUGA2_50990 [Duganella sp. HH101]